MRVCLFISLSMKLILDWKKASFLLIPITRDVLRVFVSMFVSALVATFEAARPRLFNFGVLICLNVALSLFYWNVRAIIQ